MGVAVRVLAVIALSIGLAHAQPDPSTYSLLRDGNAAAVAGDWTGLARLVDRLLQRQLAAPDLAEAHRLAGIAEFFQQHGDAAERHFLAYLRIDFTGRLDPALYPPEVVAFFNDVASRHAAELRAPRSSPQRSWWLTLVPPLGQFQNGDRAKAYALGGVLGALLVVNLTTYYYLNKWCQSTDGSTGSGLSCYNGGDHNHDAARIRPTNIATGLGFLAVYAYGVFDGVLGYRRQSRERAVQPFVAISADDRLVGVMGHF